MSVILTYLRDIVSHHKESLEDVRRGLPLAYLCGATLSSFNLGGKEESVERILSQVSMLVLRRRYSHIWQSKSSIDAGQI